MCSNNWYAQTAPYPQVQNANNFNQMYIYNLLAQKSFFIQKYNLAPCRSQAQTFSGINTMYVTTVPLSMDGIAYPAVSTCSCADRFPSAGCAADGLWDGELDVRGRPDLLIMTHDFMMLSGWPTPCAAMPNLPQQYLFADAS